MINTKSIVIALVVGETSGDILGAGLIKALRKHVSNIHFVGIAGPLMQAEGCESWYEMEELAVMGIIEIISRLRRIFYIRNDLIYRLIKLKPDVFIGIDAPDFNIYLEYSLKKYGIKTIHYVSPSIWAWREKRIFKIRKAVNLILVLFPFEKIIYDKFNIPCYFVGHNIADSIPLNPDKNAARNMLNISHNTYCLALLPGSRINEIKMLSAIFLKTAQILRQIYPHLEIIIPLANSNCRKYFEQIKSNVAFNLQTLILNGKSREALIASDVALLASGTSTLECMLAKCPMVVGYRMKTLTFWIVKSLVKIDSISLPNLLAGRKIVKEFLQKECNPQLLSKAILDLLKDKNQKYEMYKTFKILHKQIRCNADARAAEAVLNLLKY